MHNHAQHLPRTQVVPQSYPIRYWFGRMERTNCESGKVQVVWICSGGRGKSQAEIHDVILLVLGAVEEKDAQVIQVESDAHPFVLLHPAP